MTREETIQNIKATHVSIGQEFKSYKELCNYIGISCDSGKAYKTQKALLDCYISYEKVSPHSNKIVITNTFYTSPKALPIKSRTIRTTDFNGPMQDFINDYENWLPGILYNKHNILVALNIIPDAKTDYSDPPQRAYVLKASSVLESAITQLQEKEKMGSSLNYSISKCVATCLIDSDGIRHIKKVLPQKDAELYQAIKKEVYDSLNTKAKPIQSLFDVYKYNKQKAFWGKTEELVEAAFGEKVYIYEGYKFIKKRDPRLGPVPYEVRNFCTKIAQHECDANQNMYEDSKKPAFIGTGMSIPSKMEPAKFIEEMNNYLDKISSKIKKVK